LKNEREQPVKILQIGNYPPPACGWAMQTKLLVEELRQRGHVCQVLNINESRKKKSREYVDVQNGFDYLYKLVRFAGKGYQFQMHVNGQSKTGYGLALLAALVGKLSGRPVSLSWQGGLQQKYFPRPKGQFLRQVYRMLFLLCGKIACNDIKIKKAIESYGIAGDRVVAIPAFSRQNLEFHKMPLDPGIAAFLASHHPVFFCYVSFRPEYQLPMLRVAMEKFRLRYKKAGYVWLGFPSKEFPAAQTFVATWPHPERESLLLLGNLSHDAFSTLLASCFAYIRTPACDGVAASVLESLALGVPVIASENYNRPPQVTTYREDDPDDLCEKLIYVAENYQHVKEQSRLTEAEDNIARTAEWLLEPSLKASELAQDFASAD
jgi:glycosyltransferase involved in cell wall biosynthesis